VLITGETGTGKELIARELHSRSQRAKHPFVTINCGAIPENLLESELFGHVRGAFTGAVGNKLGRFQSADHGTLFLDEIGEMPLGLQVKILRALQEKVVVRVGDTRPETIDIRIVAATNRDLEVEMKAGRFREDLYYRLNVVHLHLPPLHDRGDDIVVLARYMVGRYAPEYGGRVRGLTPNAIAAIKRHRWPGNIRELENVIERAVLMRGKGIIRLTDLPKEILSPRSVTPKNTPIPRLPEDGTDLRAMLEAVEERMIGEALERTGGNKNRAAELLGMNRTTLVEKLRRKRVA
jgi:transcriptional regulator with PAS, ATPase and Fis domain